MNRIACAGLTAMVDREVLIRGWIERLRPLKSSVFMVVRDYSGSVQVVLDAGLIRETPVQAQSAVEIRGRVVPEERAKAGFEIHASRIRVFGQCEEAPLVVSAPSLQEPMEQVLTHRSFSLRHPAIRAIFRIQAEIVTAFARFLSENGFTRVHTPKLVAWGTEGGAELFSLDYFEHRAFLAQSPQFYKQMMVGSGLELVFEAGPVFRAESHNTSRHLNEYTSLDVEMGFIESETDLIDLEIAMLRYIFTHLGRECAGELALYHVTPPVCELIPRVTLAEAGRILQCEFNKALPGGQLDSEGERLLGQYFQDRHNSPLVFVTHYPVEIRPMYALPDPADPGLTLSFDLLFNGMEVTTGGMRIHDYQQLRANMIRLGLNPDDFADYLNVFRQGMPPHGGFAIGLERLTMQLLGLGNIREACLFPRDRDRLAP